MDLLLRSGVSGGAAAPYGAMPAAPAGGSPWAGYGRDVYAGASAPVQAKSVASDAGFLGWLGGLLAGCFWAIPRLGKFGPVGFFTGVIVALGCAFYGGRVVGAGEELVQGQPRGAVEVGAWFVGARLAAGAIANMRNPGALLAAFVIWLGSWIGGKVLGLVWPAK